MRAAIRFDGVSKRFILHKERARSFQELVVSLARRQGNEQREVFWALQDVSFEVAPGETVGLIGSNGAGKSTALNLVSRILEPTSGRIEVNGRVGALLELGAGFHPDLTGRENIYLNGSILGLTRAEIRCRLDEIVAFAELERFIDVPVKHYSSGMYVRLGFSVAVHTEPELLLVDEVLAVGDAAFQRKCLDRISQLRRQGVTVLFVSHNAEVVRSICSRAIWLEKGQLVADGSAESVITRYLDHSWAGEERGLRPGGKDEHRWGSGKARIVAVRLLDDSGQEKRVFHSGEPLVVTMAYCTDGRVESPVFGLAIHRSDEVHVTGPNTGFSGLHIPFIEGEGSVTYRAECLPLLQGMYFLSVSIVNEADTEIYDYHDRVYPFKVRQPDRGERYGLMTLGGKWAWHGGE